MPNRRSLLIYTLLALLAPSASHAENILSIQQDRSEETIILTPIKSKPHKIFTLDKPDRLVIDLPDIKGANPALPSSYKSGLIQKIRSGHFNTSTSRIVFELNEKITVQNKEEKNGKITIGIKAAQQKESSADRGPSLSSIFGRIEKPNVEAAKPGKDRITNEEKQEAKQENSSLTPFRKASDKNRKPKPEPKLVKEKEVAPEKKFPSRERKTIESRSKKEKPVIVIDAGHGGVDPGTSGATGTVEKMIVLEYAKSLRNRLQQSGKYRVLLTREDDEFIMLRKRVEIARKADADVFISLHADSAPGAARGLSIYTVSEKASDEEAEKLAAQENKSDILAGVNLEGEREDVAGILISLAERDTKNRSATLADLLVNALDDHVHLLADSHRFAGFAVLKAPDIPSVLIEIGFLSSPQEEKLIKSKTYRDKVVGGIADGVETYFKKERQLQE